jgi:hydrogenase/urease accessory protein HupE
VIVSGLESAADAATLPEFVTVVAVWRNLPFVPNAVIPRFDLSEAFVMLVLDENLGGSAAAPNPTAIPTAPADEEPSTPPATPAAASSWWRMVSRALGVGYEHIVPHGLDHILFVLGLFFAVRRFRDLLWQVTMFTIAHSITLGLAMTGVVVLSAAWARAVEIGIAVSIVAVAAENCLVRHAPGWRRLAVVGAFGLIHGLGFAGALSTVNWPANQFAVALLAANIGIELGQLTVVGGAALLTAWAWPRRWYRGGIALPASIAIGACGLYWAIQRIAGAVGS